MARINLLPWREELRKQRQKDFGVVAVIALLFAAAGVFGVHLFMQKMIEYQDTRNQFLKEQIKIVDKQLEKINALEEQKARLLARMNIIQQLQQSRPEVVHLFDELVATTPEGTFLTNVRQVQRNVTVQGMAQSNTRISAFMRSVEASEWLTDPNLQVIAGGRGSGQQSYSSFTLNVTMVNPNAPEEEAEAAAPSKGKGKNRRKR